MNPAERVQQLAFLLEGTHIALLELTGPDGVLRLRRAAAPHEAAAPETDDALVLVPAPSVGVFRARHPIQDTLLVQPGSRLEAGDVVGLIQVDMLLLHVLAPTAGVVSEVLAADGDVVGYGVPLFRMVEARV